MHRLLSVAVALGLLSAPPLSSALALPRQAPVQGSGEACVPSPGGGSPLCYPMEVSFDPCGGPVVGAVQGSYTIPAPGPGMDSIVTGMTASFAGEFAGGEGGVVQGDWSGTNTVSGYPLPQYNGAFAAGGTWQGTLGAGGGSGTFSIQSTFYGSTPQTGTWRLAYSAFAFESGLLECQSPATQTPAATAPPDPPDLPVGLPFDSLQALRQAIAEARERGTPPGPRVYPWLGGQLVTLHVDEAGRIYVRDVYGTETTVDEHALPAGAGGASPSPAAPIISAQPQIPWLTALDGFGDRTGSLLGGWLSAGGDLLTGAGGGLQPFQPFVDLLGWVTGPVIGADEGLSPEESQTVQTEAFALQVGAVQQEGQAALEQASEEWLEEMEEQVMAYEQELAQEEREQLQRHQSLDAATNAFLQRLGERTVTEVEREFGLDPDETQDLHDKLMQLGADPARARELARATQALRTIMNLGGSRTFSTGGVLDAIMGLVRGQVARDQALGAVLDDEGLNMSDDRLSMIHDANGLRLFLRTADNPYEQALHDLLRGTLNIGGG